MRNLLFFFTLGFMLSCAPSGELSRTIHPPHKKYIDRTASQKNQIKTDLASNETLLIEGLPASCRMIPGETFCLSCEEEGIHISRCYDYKGPFTPEKDCRYNRESLKCLMKDPPFALHLEYKNSEERFFKENVSTWTQTVHEIWGPKLEAKEKEDSERILAILDLTTKALISKEALDQKDEEAIAKIANTNDPKAIKMIRDYLAKIENDRRGSELRLSKVLVHLEELDTKIHGKSTVFTKFSTLSLDGLE